MNDLSKLVNSPLPGSTELPCHEDPWAQKIHVFVPTCSQRHEACGPLCVAKLVGIPQQCTTMMYKRITTPIALYSRDGFVMPHLGIIRVKGHIPRQNEFTGIKSVRQQATQ